MADATLLGYGIWIVGPAAAVAALVTISLLDLFEETHVPAKTRRALTLVAAGVQGFLISIPAALSGGLGLVGITLGTLVGLNVAYALIRRREAENEVIIAWPD
ncbi:MAG: hypothetical protein H6684_16510 [Deltaproteobacteria bacterium]|nr:hypothetical protein [Deltaproteobacteria bacterium]MCB9490336.1 hypothetical protein [Deltaproteobacteria bacterium]